MSCSRPTFYRQAKSDIAASDLRTSLSKMFIRGLSRWIILASSASASASHPVSKRNLLIPPYITTPVTSQLSRTPGVKYEEVLERKDFALPTYKDLPLLSRKRYTPHLAGSVFCISRIFSLRNCSFVETVVFRKNRFGVAERGRGGFSRSVHQISQYRTIFLHIRLIFPLLSFS